MSKSDLETLARWRTLGARHSEQVVELAQKVLRAGKVGDQEWSIREQLAIAALDLGQSKIANTQIQYLHRQFPSSPRVSILDGLSLEVKGDPQGAKDVYDRLIREDETNVSAHQRLISLSLSTAGSTTTIPLLLSYLDTFYSDAAGWSLLAELYSDLGLYNQSLTALGHMSLISTFDESVVRRMGETAYTMGDYQLALKHFLRATEMEGGPEEAYRAGRTRTRSWWGVKLATRRLLDSPSALAETSTSIPIESQSTPEQLEKLDGLATERLLAAGGAGIDVRRNVLGQESVVR